MRRYLTITSGGLIAAMLLNVLVAWALALWSPEITNEGRGFAEADRRWREIVPPPHRDAGGDHIGHVIEHFGYTYEELVTYPGFAGAPSVRFVRAGWPLPSFTGVELSHDGTSERRFVLPASVLPAAVLPANPRSRFLPYRPVPVGVLGNTLYYGLFILLIVLLAHASRRLRAWRRRRGGLCPVCKYPSGSASRCTECGASLASDFNAKRRR